ncbi:MAG: hypothetical protein ACW990_00255 [Promethearchaeota archaeon]|jgi:NTP pyrophosphatase (non-canonical NTP hydrolase)
MKKAEELALYDKAIEKYPQYQVNMIVEESSELIEALSTLNQYLMKLNRKSDTGITAPQFLMEQNKFLDITDQVAEEFADVFIMLSQFDRSFQNLFKNWVKTKLERLGKRMKKTEK